MSIEAMKRALEALEYCKHLAECQRVWGGTEWSYPFPWKRIFDSTTKSLHTIRTAIEQSEKQEPVAWMVYTLDGKSVCVTDNPQDFSDKNRVLPLYTTPPAAQSQDIKSGHQLDVAGHASTATITKWSYRDCGSEGWFIAETVAAPGGLLPKQEPVDWDDLLGAVARGWGHSKNAHKEMDSDLALAIAEEVKSLLKEKNT